MTSPNVRIAGAAVLVTTVAVAVYVASWPTQRAPTDATGRPTSPSMPNPTRLATDAGPTPVPTTTAVCQEEPGALAGGLTHPACPSAIVAVQLAVAPVRLPIDRIVIEPGPFFCDVVWPGAQSPVTCFGFMVRPGQYMHAWVSFAGSPKVAAVMLGLDLPADDAPLATRPPWQATLVTVAIPPSGWVMP